MKSAKFAMGDTVLLEFHKKVEGRPEYSLGKPKRRKKFPLFSLILMVVTSVVWSSHFAYADGSGFVGTGSLWKEDPSKSAEDPSRFTSLAQAGVGEAYGLVGASFAYPDRVHSQLRELIEQLPYGNESKKILAGLWNEFPVGAQILNDSDPRFKAATDFYISFLKEQWGTVPSQASVQMFTDFNGATFIKKGFSDFIRIQSDQRGNKDSANVLERVARSILHEYLVQKFILTLRKAIGLYQIQISNPQLRDDSSIPNYQLSKSTAGRDGSPPTSGHDPSSSQLSDHEFRQIMDEGRKQFLRALLDFDVQLDKAVGLYLPRQNLRVSPSGLFGMSQYLALIKSMQDLNRTWNPIAIKDSGVAFSPRQAFDALVAQITLDPRVLGENLMSLARFYNLRAEIKEICGRGSIDLSSSNLIWNKAILNRPAWEWRCNVGDEEISNLVRRNDNLGSAISSVVAHKFQIVVETEDLRSSSYYKVYKLQFIDSIPQTKLRFIPSW